MVGKLSPKSELEDQKNPEEVAISYRDPIPLSRSQALERRIHFEADQRVQNIQTHELPADISSLLFTVGFEEILPKELLQEVNILAMREYIRQRTAQVMVDRNFLGRANLFSANHLHRLMNEYDNAKESYGPTGISEDVQRNLVKTILIFMVAYLPLWRAITHDSTFEMLKDLFPEIIAAAMVYVVGVESLVHPSKRAQRKNYEEARVSKKAEQIFEVAKLHRRLMKDYEETKEKNPLIEIQRINVCVEVLQALAAGQELKDVNLAPAVKISYMNEDEPKRVEIEDDAEEIDIADLEVVDDEDTAKNIAAEKELAEDEAAQKETEESLKESQVRKT